MGTKWTLEKIKAGFESFYKSYNRYPTSHEIDHYLELPSARQIQRSFGGLVELRETLVLNGPTNFTKGEYSSERARTINNRSNRLEKEVYDLLVKRFGQICVHREFFFTDDRRRRTDFFVYSKDGNFSIDTFYPKDKYNFAGCLNSKMRTYDRELEYPVIFLMMNSEMEEDEIYKIIKNKKNQLRNNQRVLTFPQFKKFIANKGRLIANVA